jgi:hypothetical protein
VAVTYLSFFLRSAVTYLRSPTCMLGEHNLLGSSRGFDAPCSSSSCRSHARIDLAPCLQFNKNSDVLLFPSLSRTHGYVSF